MADMDALDMQAFLASRKNIHIYAKCGNIPTYIPIYVAKRVVEEILHKCLYEINTVACISVAW
jgi:hypothetical protein